VQATLANEGGYVNDPRDRGGETKWGISSRSYPELDIAKLTRDDAAAIYYRDFYAGSHFDKISETALAEKLFDFGVTAGARKSVRILQEALMLFGLGLGQDGVLGPETLGAANGFRDQAALLAAVKFLAAQHYVMCNEPHYLAGRLKRAMS
jgi:lysozyme family protein